MAYQRERTRIAATTIARARRMIAQGTVPGRGLDIADEATPGLVLRVGPQGARWMLKTRTRTVTLAPLGDMTVAAARLAAVGARANVDAGYEPAENVRIYAGARALGARPEDAADAAWPIGYVEDDKELRRREGPWAVEDLIDEFVTWKIVRLRPEITGDDLNIFGTCLYQENWRSGIAEELRTYNPDGYRIELSEEQMKRWGWEI